jgi:23S rRNA G2445 N2-methylase RlmL
MDWKYRIKKPELGTQLNWEIYFPPGLATWATENVKRLLDEIKLPNQPLVRLRTFTEKLKLENANAHQVSYLYEYGHFLRDIRLVIGKSDDWRTASSDTEGEMQRVVESALPIAKKILKQEDGMRDGKLKDALHGSYFETEITVTLSLFGEPAYMRGVKAVLPTSAPVPEDMAHALTLYAKQFADWQEDTFTFVYLPFAGTGTFGTEWQIMAENTPTHEFPKKTIFQDLSIYPEKTITHYQKLKSANKSKSKTTQLWLDTDPALLSYQQKEKRNWEKSLGCNCDWQIATGDFFKIKDPIAQAEIDLSEIDDFGVFLPINPPYGFRKNERPTGDDTLYAELGGHIQILADGFRKKKKNALKQFAGFIMCPTEEKWLLVRNHLKGFSQKTIHVTHGGIDLRVLFFQYKNQF